MFGLIGIYEVVMALTLWPLFFLSAAIIVICVSAYMESISLLIFVAFCLSIIFIFDGTGNIYKIIYENPKDAIFYFIVYISIGVLWSLFKWRRHMLSARMQNRLKTSKEQAEKDVDFDKSLHWSTHEFFPEDAQSKNNKERISSWIGLFPFSMIMFVLGDLLKDFFNFLYSLISGVYDSMTRYYLPK